MYDLIYIKLRFDLYQTLRVLKLGILRPSLDCAMTSFPIRLVRRAGVSRRPRAMALVSNSSCPNLPTSPSMGAEKRIAGLLPSLSLTRPSGDALHALLPRQRLTGDGPYSIPSLISNGDERPREGSCPERQRIKQESVFGKREHELGGPRCQTTCDPLPSR